MSPEFNAEIPSTHQCRGCSKSPGGVEASKAFVGDLFTSLAITPNLAQSFQRSGGFGRG